MKPVKLQFKGINSFSELTEIDFKTLTQNGLFGIFGDTGSGKSTILDCINFALYGSVERSKEKADIINYRSESAEVKFAFDISVDGRRKTYTVERSIKKNKYGTHKAMLYERDGFDEVCIADNASSVGSKIIQILGVEEEDFRKCIALPQGEFSQFVKSRPADRLALIERLFSLSKYGDRLKEKIAERQSKVDSEYQNVLGRLSGYEEVSEDGLKALQEQLKEETKLLSGFNVKAQNANEIYDGTKNLYGKKLQLEKIDAEIAELTAKKPEIEKLRAGLQALPKCKEVVETDEKLTAIADKIKEFDSALRLISKNTETETLNLLSYQKREKEKNFEEKIAECNRLSALFSTAQGKPEKLDKLTKELTGKREDYKVSEKKKAQLEAEKSAAEKRVKNAEEKLSSFKWNNLENFVNVQFKGAVLRGEYVNLLDYFSSLYGSVTDYEDGSKLYKFISAELKEKISEYKRRVYDVKDFKIENVSEQLKNLLSQSDEREKAIEVFNAEKQELTKIEAQIEVTDSELTALKRDGSELRSRVDDIKRELANIFGTRTDYVQAIQDNERTLKSLTEEKKIISETLENCKTKLSDLKAEFERTQALKQTADKEFCELSLKLNSLIVLSGYRNIGECKQLVNSFASSGDAVALLDEFDKKLASLNAQRCGLAETEGINTVTETRLKECETLKKQCEDKVIELNGNIAVLNSKIQVLKQKVIEKAEILKEFKRIETEKTLIARLKEVVKGNKFMEYIADEYLYDISSLASSTLLTLTDGRYFLTYKDNNFFVGDNFDCGNLRGVNTLSGGETFLVSLSLALALSQTICSRSMKSIEFFFLDEGFGTLDGSLVETVMNALEKLKSSSFTIGVISHVEELKHRIDNKITVIKATENCGSKVQLSC